jgi:hypothetical protein
MNIPVRRTITKMGQNNGARKCAAFSDLKYTTNVKIAERIPAIDQQAMFTLGTHWGE